MICFIDMSWVILTILSGILLGVIAGIIIGAWGSRKGHLGVWKDDN